MPKLWAFDVETKKGDKSVSGFLFNITVLLIAFGCDEGRAEQVIRHWHEVNASREGMRPFDAKQWPAIYQGALAHSQNKKRAREESSTEVNKPRTDWQSEIDPRFLPVEPPSHKRVSFEARRKALATLNNRRPDLDRKRSDDPNGREWLT